MSKETIQLPRMTDDGVVDDVDVLPVMEKSTPEKKKKAHTHKSMEMDADCFAMLRILRRKIADERGVPAFIIFGDATLHEMSGRKPQTLEEFITITGVGEKKLKEFGNIFITAIQAYIQEEVTHD